MYYQEFGNQNAPLIVFLHGGGVSGWMWEKQVQYFQNYYCIVPDLPEQGKSAGEGPFSIQKSAEQINQLIRQKASGQKVIVIGFSLGAQVAIQMLSLDAKLIDYAIINSALVLPSPLIKKFIKPIMKLTYPLIKNKSFSKLQAKSLYIDENNFERYYNESSTINLHTLTRILEENMSFTLPEQFSKAKAKILVTVGEKEKAMIKKSTFKIIESNPNCTGIILSNIGHGLSMANPTYFNQMIEKWICHGSLPKESKQI
ncbi:alpha/beta fold hydrolase [Lysinibacillus sp. BW-2-10]|uniref:alpha/beta fold hydrolase n=1 Tax=Lysinibacillus sp. BW-2-10 TaxID=2590030 RepID=UPI0021041808|nr:alpha/beta hydrolase [Lysinibacillus sp. BW-2-10]